MPSPFIIFDTRVGLCANTLLRMSIAPSHRTWPLPTRRWTVAMRWNDLLFAHWPVKAAALRDLIPPSLAIDQFENEAWLGIVPFWMNGIRRNGLPALPGLSGFAELNVRTYVTTPDGKPGVWFFSLDAAHRIGVRVARRCYHLQYYDACIKWRREGETIDYASRRLHPGAPSVQFAGRYRPTGPPERSTPGTLPHWLTARYCLYAASKQGRVVRAEINHDPWPLQPAELEISENTMCDPLGVTLPETPPLLHFARRIDAVSWSPDLVSPAS
jgi:uncharacterized protein